VAQFGVVAIVKDEEDSVGRMLASVGECPTTIVDTGSTDGTIERLAEMGVIAHEVPFVNFGQARSAAFSLARGSADWLLALDADMTVEIDPDFEPDPAVDAYMLRLGSDDFSYRLPLLLRGDLQWQSIGACHEYTALPDRAYVSRPTDKVRITNHGNSRWSREKSLWQLGLLEAELAEQPTNARTVFYLANTLWDLGRTAEALAMYRRRNEMSGWVEETFYSRYRFALCQPTWPARMLALIDAWEYRPGRLEPAHELAREFNLRGQHHSAYRFASLPVVEPPDNLFVHRGVYEWGMDFERSISAWWLGKWDEFDALTERLLDNPRLPGNIREAVIRNRECERAA
jgi:glycosyltransferase involved in cell wall biosynthesis